MREGFETSRHWLVGLPNRLRVERTRPPSEHQVNIKSTFQDQDRDVFSDADMLQTYWTTMRAGDAQEGSRRALDFFNQEQSDGMALWEAIIDAERESIARLIPHLINRVVLDFNDTKRKAAIKYWRREPRQGTAR
jgi:hypothetical protein